MRALAATALLAALALVAACSRGAGSKEDATTDVPVQRELAPGFTLQDLAGTPVSLASFRGKTVLIDFWATWCPPCEFQVPVLNAYYEAHKAEGLVVLGVAVDAQGRAAVAPYAARHKIRYPVLLGSEALARDFGVPGFPALAVVAPDGSLATLHVGMAEEPELDKIMAGVRAGTAAQAAARPSAADATSIPPAPAAAAPGS